MSADLGIQALLITLYY